MAGGIASRASGRTGGGDWLSLRLDGGELRTGSVRRKANLSAFLWVRRLNKSLATRLRESLTEQDSKLVHGGFP
ncbi:hypothetical protein, partial [Burkholderia ubonensis]|uniref:hypothetical protein n=1 Tax=Burkholderia ubonensis TaxID=101571 RepID=UPI001E3B2679